MTKRIAFIFDFDDTLAFDSTTSFLHSKGVDAQSFWKERVQPLDDNDWDPIPAYLYQLLEESKQGLPITKTDFQNHGKKIVFHPGVEQLFTTLNSHAKALDEEIVLEFFIISSGIGEIIRATTIAPYIKQVFASEFHYNEKEEIAFPKKIVSFSDKTRYLFQISKGILGREAYGNPYAVNKKVYNDDYYIPMNQMIFVGDGLTDVPCFSLMKQYGGVSFAVYDKERSDRWGKAWAFLKEGRVTSISRADYRAESGLMDTLMMSINDIASRFNK